MKTREIEDGSALKVGDVVEYGKKEYVVWFKNESRAAIAPLDGPIQYRVRDEDGKVQFMAKENSENVSPNSEMEVLRRLGRTGLADLIEARNTKRTPMKKDSKKNKNSKNSKPAAVEDDGAPRLGKLGGFEHHSVTSTLRACGKAGWSLAETREFCRIHELGASDTTIKIQTRAGKVGTFGPPAEISKATLAKLRPEVPEEEEKTKPAPKASKKDKKGAKAKPAKSGKKDKKTSKPVEEEATAEEAEEVEEAVAE